MKKKQVITLLFSLLTVAVGSNLKAASEGPRSPKTNPKSPRARIFWEKKSDLRAQIQDLEAALKQAQDKNGQNCQEDLTNCEAALDGCKQHSNELEQDRDRLSANLLLKTKELQVLQLEIDGDETHSNPGLRLELANASRQLDEYSNEVQVQEGRYQSTKAESSRLQNQIGGLQDQVNNLQNQVDNFGENINTFNQCKPYAHGTAVAGATYLAFSRFGGKRTELLRKAVGDSTVLQGSSLAAASCGKEPHQWLSKRRQAEIDYFKGNDLKAGAINVAGETGNSLLLRWGWKRWFANRVETGSNIIARTIRQSPEVVKDLTRLIAIHTCWNWEKNFLFSGKIKK